ncbi:DUF6257 family protein [Streptomyces sp. NPDC000594]|uniref:DUF6257 family protein n=1 Tax=Streptomyces sp. NPDC000594 TaxID=3154261 RepID=UPI003317BC34
MFRPENEPQLTVGEKTRIGWLIARMAKRGIAAHNSPTGDVYQADLQKKLDKVLDGARKREEEATRSGRARRR